MERFYAAPAPANDTTNPSEALAGCRANFNFPERPKKRRDAAGRVSVRVLPSNKTSSSLSLRLSFFSELSPPDYVSCRLFSWLSW